MSYDPGAWQAPRMAYAHAQRVVTRQACPHCGMGGERFTYEHLQQCAEEAAQMDAVGRKRLYVRGRAKGRNL